MKWSAIGARLPYTIICFSQLIREEPRRYSASEPEDLEGYREEFLQLYRDCVDECCRLCASHLCPRNIEAYKTFVV
jgi:hypothetical protein